MNETRTRMNILFVCTGNICRSPMAEALFRHRIGARAACAAGSAGVAAPPGTPASEEAVEALREWGIDLENHRSRSLTPGLVEEADLILVMTWQHRQQILALSPQAEDKIKLITAFQTDGGGADIPDPIGQSLTTYRHVRDRLDSAVSDLILALLETGQLHLTETEGQDT